MSKVLNLMTFVTSYCLFILTHVLDKPVLIIFPYFNSCTEKSVLLILARTTFILTHASENANNSKQSFSSLETILSILTHALEELPSTNLILTPVLEKIFPY